MRNMKYGKLLALSGALFLSSAVYSIGAQTPTETPNPPATGMQERGPRRHGFDRPRLNLTDDQKVRLKSLHESVRQQAQALRNDTTLSAEEKRAKIRSLRESTRQQFQSVLTPEQQEQMKTARENHRGRHGFGRGFGRHGGPRMDLGLTADQRTQLQGIHKNTRDQVSAIRNDTTLTSEQKEAKLKSVFESAHQQTNNILTPEQQQKMKEGHRHGRFGGPRGEHRGRGAVEGTVPAKP
jgi:Spy/CpxP family protein refolding chaperone